MGVYIPPPRGEDSSNTNAVNSGSDSSNSSNSSSESDTTIIIKIPNNPSLGLFSGPFTPAADNLPALYGVTGLQLLVGLWCFKKARRIIRPIPVPVPGPLPHSMIPNKRGSWFEAAIPTVIGTILITGAGLEIGRFTLSYDPWYEEAKYYRKLAIKNGIKVSSWFGAYKYYNPIDTNTWSDKVIDHLKMVNEKMENNKLNKTKIKPSILLQLNKKAKYFEIYKKIHESNKARYADLLNNDLANVSESNKNDRKLSEADLNSDIDRLQLHLEGPSFESDKQLDAVWTAFDPWDELSAESYSDMRMIPIFVLNFENYVDKKDQKDELEA